MPLTARTSGRHQSRQARHKRSALLAALSSTHLHGRMCLALAEGEAGSVARQRPLVILEAVCSAVVRGSRALPRQGLLKAGPNGGTWPERGRYGKRPVRMGSAARSRREGKAFPSTLMLKRKP